VAVGVALAALVVVLLAALAALAFGFGFGFGLTGAMAGMSGGLLVRFEWRSGWVLEWETRDMSCDRKEEEVWDVVIYLSDGTCYYCGWDWTFVNLPRLPRLPRLSEQGPEVSFA
jgi:hypothetical protein